MKAPLPSSSGPMTHSTMARSPVILPSTSGLRETGGPVLELACGTGRIALVLVERGFDIIGIDISHGMLALARCKAATLPAPLQERLTLVNQDMGALNLGRRFGLVFVPARSFQHLLTIDLQRRSLESIRRHLEPTGRLALHLFDPRLDLLIDANTAPPGLSGIHPETGRRYVGEVLQTNFDHLNQVRRDLWRYTKSVLTARCLLRKLARWSCAGPIAGSCIICSTSVV
jgi:SAM-dependent methyltransferase